MAGDARLDFSKVPFAEATDYMRDKLNLPTRKWTDIWEGMHARAFVVAGAMKSEVLVDLHNAINKAIAEGTTITDFRKAFDATIKKNGWNYKGDRGWRTGVIYDTNLRTAYAAGHYKQMMDPAVRAARPYWRYIGGLSEHPRPLHLSWSGTVLRYDDPWWNTHYPPSAWGCKCQVVSASVSELERDGHRVSPKAPADGTYEWTNPDTGEIITIPKGIDPGWAYNVGKAAWGYQEAKRVMEDAGPWEDVDPWGPGAYRLPEKLVPVEAEAKMGTRTHGEKALRQALKDAIGGDEAAFMDPTGEQVLVNQALTDHMIEDPKRYDGREAYFPFMKQLVEHPSELWISFARSELTGKVAIRKKFVTAIKLDKDKAIGMVAESRNGVWTGLTFYPGNLKGLNSMRMGRLLWKR